MLLNDKLRVVMAASESIPFSKTLVSDEAEVRLVGQCGRLQGVVGVAVSKLATGDRPEIRVDERPQTLRGAGVAAC